MKICFRLFCSFISIVCLARPSWAGELHGRVIDRGTFKNDGSAHGIPGAKISVYDGKKLIASSVTNSKGEYRFKKINLARCRVVYRAANYHPSSISRDFSPLDTASRDLYLDADHRDDAVAKVKGKSGYYQGLARGFFAMVLHQEFFREDQADSLVNISSFFDPQDSSEDYRCVMVELLWAEFLSQDRPLETRYYLAAGLAPMLDSLGWGKLKDMDRYLEVPPLAVMNASQALRAAFKNPKKLPNPGAIRKLGISINLASQIANEYLADPGISETAKDRFLTQWKKTWGKDAPSYRDEGDGDAFMPNSVITKLADSKPDNQEVKYLLGRGLFAAHKFSAAAQALGEANKLAGGHSAARYLEALAYIRLGRDQEALGRFQALREAPNPYWKSRAYRGLAELAEKESRHSEAANNLWKAQRLLPDPENVYRLAEVSLTLTDRSEVEKLLEARAGKSSDHQAQYWLGRYAEANQQPGVAEDNYRKAWATAPAAEYAEALSRIYLAREEFGPALSMLESVRSRLTPEGRRSYAECLLQAGRYQDAAKEFALAFAEIPKPEVLERYVEALIQSHHPQEAAKAANGFADQTHPLVRLSVAKASVANHDGASARPILESLIKSEPTNPQFHYLLGQIFYDVRNYSKAKNAFDEALHYRQDFPDAIYYCALTAIKMGKAEGAKALLNELIQRSSAEWKAKGLLGMGIAFAAQQKSEAAESYFQRSLDVQETSEAEAQLAMSRQRLGAPEKWVGLAKKAFSLDPNDPDAISIMGEALLAQGKKVQALAVLKKGLEGNPNSCDLLTALAKCQFLMGSAQSAKSTAVQSIGLCPQEPLAHYYAGMAAAKLQDHKEAESYFKSFRKAGGEAEMIPDEYR